MERTTAIDQLIKNIEAQIEKLQELRLRTSKFPLPIRSYDENSFKVGQKLRIRSITVDGKRIDNSITLKYIVYAITKYFIVVEKLNKFGHAVYKTCFKYTDFETGVAEVM